MTQTGSVMGTFAYMSLRSSATMPSRWTAGPTCTRWAPRLYTILTLKTSAELFFAEARDEILSSR